MKSLMLLLALALASSDKLDRTYLPPPGSKIAGGSDGAIQVPLEFPKQTYSTTVRPLIPGQKEDGFISAGNRQPTIGVGLPNISPGSPDLVPVTPGLKTPFGDLQNKVPTPTTTYAFTQTTTFPPLPQGFENIVNAIGPTGFPSDVSRDIQSDVYTPANKNQGYPQSLGPAYVQPGSQIVQRPGVPTLGTVQRPGYQTPAQTFVGQPGYSQPGYSQPGYSQPSKVQNIPGQTFSTTISPIAGSPSGLTKPPFDQGYTQYLGVQPPRQFGQEVVSSSLAPQDVSQNYRPGLTPTYYGNAVQRPAAPEAISLQQIGGQRPQNLQYTIQPDVQHVTDDRGNIVSSSSQDLGGQRPLFGGQPGPLQPATSPQIFNNVQMIPGSNLPQQLRGQQAVFRGQQAPAYPSSTTVPQPGSYPQYSNVLPGSNISQPDVQSMNQQQESYTDVPQYQETFNKQGSVIPGSTTPQIIGSQPQFNNRPGFTPTTVSPQGISFSYQPDSSQLGVIQPSVDQLGVDQPGVIHSTQTTATGNIPQTTTYPGQPGRIFLGKPDIIQQPTQGSFNQNNYQTTEPKFSLQQRPDRPGVQNIYELDSTSPTSLASAGYNQPYSSTTPGTIPGSFPSTTISPIRISSSTPYPLPGQTDIIPEKILRPERPQAEFDRNAEILNYKNVLTPDGEFEYSFDTSNGIHADENGTSIDGVKAEGSYSYIGDDGKFYSVIYSADENGFRPQGAHLPTPPPIPDAIQKVIEQAAKDREAGISHDGYYDEDKYGHKKYQSPNRLRPQQQDKLIRNGADVPDDYDEVIRPGQIKPGQVRPDQIREGQVKSDRVRPGLFKPATKVDESQPFREPNTGSDVDKYDEYILKNGELNDGNVKPGSRVSSKRPFDKQKNKYNYDEDRRVIASKTPSSTGFRGDYKDQYLPGVTDTSNRYFTTPGRKPISKPGLIKGRYESEDMNENQGSVEDYEKDSRLPTGPETKYYEKDKQRLPGRLDQQYSVTERPAGTRRPVSTTMRYSDEKVHTSEPEAQQVKEPGRRPLKPSPGSSYKESENNRDYYETDVPESNIVGGKPQGSRRPVSQSSKYYPGQTLKPGQPGLTNYESTDDDEEEIYDKEDVRRPYDQDKETKKSKYPLQPENKNTGYQYLPPQTKFQEIDGIPAGQSTAVTIGSSTRRPVTKEYSDDKTATPDIYRDEGTFYENADNVTVSRKPVKKPDSLKTYPDKYVSTDGPRYNEKEIEGMKSQPQYGDKYSDNESIQQGARPGYGGSRYPKPDQLRPGQVYFEERVEGSKIPSYVMSSTTPMPSRGRDPTKGIPQYEQNYDKSVPSSTTIPGLRIPGRPRPGYDETTTPGSSSLTPGQADISRPSSRLSYQYSDRPTPGVSREYSNRPGQKIDEYSTTGSDSIYIDQTQPDYTPENFGVSRRPTTYYPDTIVPGSNTIRPGIKIPSRPGIHSVPSTTYRPNYTVIDETTGRPVTVDAFGTPISTTYRPERPGSNTVFDKFRPVQGPGTSGVQTTAQVFRPNEPRLQQTSPPSFVIQRPGNRVSSTTERIIGEDFSGPKQPQRFDPKTGYHY